MARIGSLFIAGTDELDGVYKCGISYTLAQKALASFIYNTKDGNWQVEFATASTNVVARQHTRFPITKPNLMGFLPSKKRWMCYR